MIAFADMAFYYQTAAPTITSDRTCADKKVCDPCTEYENAPLLGTCVRTGAAGAYTYEDVDAGTWCAFNSALAARHRTGLCRSSDIGCSALQQQVELDCGAALA